VAAALEAGGERMGAITLVGRGKTANAGFAAFYNGALAHALEYDDSTLNPVGHPSCVIVPALLALAEQTGASGRAVLEAYLVGLEVHARLGQAEAGGWSAGGAWLPIGHVSLVGAAAACAKLLALSEAQIGHALGLAAHFSGDLAVSNGAIAKPLGAGASARAGLECALLAGAGATGPARAIERPQGFAEVFLGGAGGLAKAFERLGAPHHLEEVGIAIKRFPSCYATHWGVDALLLLLAEHGLAAGDIQSIRLEHPEAGAFCDNPNPTDPESARFSHEYNLAVAALDGVPGPASYTAERLARADVRALLGRVRTANHAPDLAPPKAWEYLVTVTTTGGESFARAVPRPLGHPRHPMSAADLETKFLTCAEPALGRAAATRLMETLGRIETLADLRPISEILSMIEPAKPGHGRLHATLEGQA
jgi:2-methylcitrate dehydratase PrpD